MPLPHEPITPDNVDRIQTLAMWGKGAIKQLAHSPDGKMLAVGTTAGVWLYDADTLTELRFINTGNFVLSMAFTEDSRQLVTDVGASTIIIWDVATGEKLDSVRVRDGFLSSGAGSNPQSVFSNGATLLAATLDDYTVSLWEAAGGKRLQTVRSDISTKTLAISPDGNLLAIGGYSEIKVWDVGAGTLLYSLPAFERSTYSLAFSPDSKVLVAGGNEGKIWLWNAQTGASINILEGGSPASLIGPLAFSSDNALLAAVVYEPSSASTSSSTQIWRMADGTLLHTLKEARGGISLIFSPDNRMLVSGASNGIVRRWNTQTGALVDELTGFDTNQGQAAQAPPLLAFLPDGNAFISNPSNYQIELWDLKRGQMLKTLTGHESLITNMVLSVDGHTLVSAELWTNTVRIWNPTTGQKLGTYEVYIDTGYSKELAISPNGQLIALGDARANWRTVYDSTDLDNPLYKLPKITWSSDPVFSSDGQKIAKFTDINTTIVSKAESGELLHTLSTGGHSTGLAFAPDNKMLAVGTRDGKVQLWDSASSELVNTLNGQTDNIVVSLAYSPDGQILATGMKDAQMPTGALTPTIWLWEVKTGKLLKTIEGYQANIVYLAFSPDGALLATASLDGTMRLWGIPPE